MRPELFDKGATVGHRSIGTIGWAARIVLLAAVTTAPAMAASPVPRDTPPGAIIYIRDVPTRQADIVGEPGRPHFVNANPSQLIVNSLATGLRPLSDQEVAQVIASTDAKPGAIGRALADVASTGSIIGSTGLGATSGGGGGGSIVAGALDRGLSALSGALAAATSHLGGPK